MKAKIANQYNQVPHVTEDTECESGKTQENQEVSPFLTGGHKAIRNRHHRMEKINTITKKIIKRNTNSFLVHVDIIIAKISIYITVCF